MPVAVKSTLVLIGGVIVLIPADRRPFIELDRVLDRNILVDADVRRELYGIGGFAIFIEPHQFIRRADEIYAVFILLRLGVGLTVPCGLDLQHRRRDACLAIRNGEVTADRLVAGAGNDVVIAAIRQAVASVSLRRQRFLPRRAGDGDGRVDRLVVRRRDRADGHGVGIQRRELHALRVRRLVAGHGKRARRVLIAERLDAVAVLAVRLRQAVDAPAGDLRGLPVHHQHRALVRVDLKFYGVELDIQADVDGLPAVGNGERARRVIVLVRRDLVVIVAVRQAVGVPAHGVDRHAVLQHGQRRVLRREGKRDGIFRRRVLPAKDGIAALCIRRIAAAEQTGHIGCFQLALHLGSNAGSARIRAVAAQTILRQIVAIVGCNNIFCLTAGTLYNTAANYAANRNIRGCCGGVCNVASIIAVCKRHRIACARRISDNTANTLCVGITKFLCRRNASHVTQVVAILNLCSLCIDTAYNAAQCKNACNVASVKALRYRSAKRTDNTARALECATDCAGIAAKRYRAVAAHTTGNAASAIIIALRLPSIYNVTTIQTFFNCHAAARCRNASDIIAAAFDSCLVFAVL